MSRVLLVASDNDLGRRIRSLPGHQVATLNKSRVEQEGVQSLSHFNSDDMPHVVVLGDEIPLDKALAFAHHIDSKFPQLEVVIVAEPDAEILLQAMRVGVRDIVSPNTPDSEIQVLLLRTADSASVRNRAEPVGGGVDASGASRVIVVASPKGGVGKTTLSTNVSVGLAEVAPMDTVLVDLDLQFGDVATALDLKPTHTLADAFAVSNVHDTLILKSFLTVHPAGFYVLCGAESPAANERVSATQIRELLRQLTAQFKYVVVDTASGLNDHTLAALEEATDVLLVSTMDVSCIRAVRKAISLLSELDLLPAERHVVLNFADRRSGMSVRDVEGVIGLPVNVVVPRSNDVPLAGNRGEPILLKKRGGPVQKAIRSLVKRFQGETKSVNGKIHRGWRSHESE